MSASLPPGVRVRTAPTRDDVVALRRAYLRRQALQVRTMRLTSNLLVVLTVVFAVLSTRMHHPLTGWIITGVSAVFCVLSRLLVRRIVVSVEHHYARPVTTVFTGDALWIDDEDDIWTIPYADVVQLDRSHQVNEIVDSAGGRTLLPLGAIPDPEVGRFTA